MSRRLYFLSLLIFVLFFAAPSYTYASYINGSIATRTVDSSSISLSFTGVSGQTYHFYLEVSLPYQPFYYSRLNFGTPSTPKPIIDYDFISLVGNRLIVDFYFLSDGSSSVYRISTNASELDLSQSEILSYGVVPATSDAPAGSTMFIYDSVLALRQWYNISHYVDGIVNNLSVSTSNMSIPSYSYTANNHYDPITGDLTSVSLNTEPSTTYRPLDSASLSGSLSLTANNFDLLNDEWGQYLDRVSTISSLSLSNPSFSSFKPSAAYFPSVSSLSITPNNGYLFTNGMSPTFLTFVADISAKPSSVSVSGCSLDAWSYNSGRLTVECHKDNQSTDTQVDLSSITISLSGLSSVIPLISFSDFCVGSFDTPSLIQHLDSDRQQSFLEKAFSNIEHSISGLASSLISGYSEDTSSSLSTMNSKSSTLSSEVSSYVATETALTSEATSYISNFNPDQSIFSSFVPAFGLVSYLSETMYNSSGDFKYLVVFILTLSCILFLLGIRRG